MQEPIVRLCPWYFVLDAYECNLLQGWLGDQWRRLRGQVTELAKFDDVAARLNARQRSPVRRQFVAVDSITGTTGRFRNFTRDFFPRPTTNRERWIALYALASRGIDLPPVELYKIGDFYFVANGHHRVSVARACGYQIIEADVTECTPSAPLITDGARPPHCLCITLQTSHTPQPPLHPLPPALPHSGRLSAP